MKDYLKGCVDMHLHMGPSVMQRPMDVAEMGYLAKSRGYKALVYKEHFLNTAPVAAMVQKHLFSDGSPLLLGSVTLNNALGGLNAEALSTAFRFGAKVAWLPTVSARRHCEFFNTSQIAELNSIFADVNTQEDLIVLTDSAGGLKPECTALLEVLRDTDSVLLGSGHVSPAEIDALVQKAAELGTVGKLFVDHPPNIIEASIEDMLRWAKAGALIELVKNVDVGLAADIIRAVGPDRVIFGSDLGQKPGADEEYNLFLNSLENEGIHEDDIRYMTSGHLTELLGLDELLARLKN